MTEFKPGMRVHVNGDTYNDHFRGKDATVQDPTYTPVAGWVRVQTDDGYVGAVDGTDLTVVMYPPITPVTERYPVGCAVRDTKYGTYGTVVHYGSAHNGPVVEFTGDDGKTYRAGFPIPEERLERVHILTHDELSVLDEAVPMTGTANQPANAILDRHLRPTVKRTFTVTVEQPADAFPVTPEGVAAVLNNQNRGNFTAKEKAS